VLVALELRDARLGVVELLGQLLDLVLEPLHLLEVLGLAASAEVDHAAASEHERRPGERDDPFHGAGLGSASVPNQALRA
jgi:hypothetical protein